MNKKKNKLILDKENYLLSSESHPLFSLINSCISGSNESIWKNSCISSGVLSLKNY